MPILSNKGQVTIPKTLRRAHNWHQGQSFQVIDTADGILLKPLPNFKETSLDQVTGCLPFHGKAKSLTEMEEAISQGGAREF